MPKTSRALLGFALVGLALPAQAGKPLVLDDQQMDAVVSGSATAATAMQSSVRGPNATLRTMVGNTAVDLGSASFAQSRSGVLGTGTSVKANINSLSSADPFQASATAAGAANGQTATLSAFAISTAVSAAPIGSTQAFSSINSFSSKSR